MNIGLAAIVVMPFTLLAFPESSKLRSAPKKVASRPETLFESGRADPKPKAPGDDWKRDVVASDRGDEPLEMLLLLFKPVAEEFGRAKRVDCGTSPVVFVFSGVEALLDELGEGSLGEEGRWFAVATEGFLVDAAVAPDASGLFAPAGKLNVKADCFKRRFSFCNRPSRSRRFSFSLSWLAARASRAATWSSS